jgi:phytoene synthase
MVMMTGTGWSVASSYSWCERLTRRAAANFYPAFRLLPAEQRRSMCALYAFSRIADDLADEPGEVEAKRLAVAAWREALAVAMRGEYRHPVFPALRDSVERHAMPVVHLEEILDGVEADLDTDRYVTFGALYRYCYRVASAVGLSCVRIWGHRGGPGLECAEAAGIALQLTNILRDVPEDAAQGRVYLPLEDLDRFGVPMGQLSHGPCDERFRALMRFQAERAAAYYEAAMPLAKELPLPGRAVFLVMVRTYRALLDEIVRRDYDVFAGRVRLAGWYKLWLAASALPVRFGLWA